MKPVFDRVVIGAGDQRRSLSTASFLELPVHQRVQHVLNRSIEFYLDDEPVERRVALASLRKREAAISERSNSGVVSDARTGPRRGA